MGGEPALARERDERRERDDFARGADPDERRRDAARRRPLDSAARTGVVAAVSRTGAAVSLPAVRHRRLDGEPVDHELRPFAARARRHLVGNAGAAVGDRERRCVRRSFVRRRRGTGDPGRETVLGRSGRRIARIREFSLPPRRRRGRFHTVAAAGRRRRVDARRIHAPRHFVRPVRHSPDVSYGNQYVEIRRTNAQEWVQLGSLASLSPWTARVAGHFELRGTATVNGRSFATTPVGIEVRFPEYDDIVSDDDVWFAMEDAWTTNLVETTPGNRREYGFWIRLDTSDGHYITAPLEAGIGVSASGGLLVPSPRPADVPSNPEPNAAGVVYTVGHFHTHTPRTYIMPTNLFRRVGPSPRDCNLMKNNQMPGIVFDYVGVSDPDGNPTNRLYNGHGLDDPAMLYPVPPERRPTPCFP